MMETTIMFEGKSLSVDEALKVLSNLKAKHEPTAELKQKIRDARKTPFKPRSKNDMGV